MDDSTPPKGPDIADTIGRPGPTPTVRLYAGLSARQGQAAEALLQGQTMARAAILAGVSERSLRRWMQKEVFRAALRNGRRDAFQQAIGLTTRYAPAAVGALVKVLNDQLAPPSARVTAAAVLLKFGREGIELDDLAERVAQLEALLAASPAALALPAPEEADEV